MLESQFGELWYWVDSLSDPVLYHLSMHQILHNNRGKGLGAGAFWYLEDRLENDVQASGRTIDYGDSFCDFTEGYFYVVAVDASDRKNWYKLGFAKDVPRRMQFHRPIAPKSEVVMWWHCRQTWEKTAIDCAALWGGQRIEASEVITSNDLFNTLSCLSQFFDAMGTVLPKSWLDKRQF